MLVIFYSQLCKPHVVQTSRPCISSPTIFLDLVLGRYRILFARVENFTGYHFNNLTFTDKAAVSQDAAAELERMKRTKKPIPEVKPNGPDSTAT